MNMIPRPKGLHFTVAATPSAGANVEQEVRMVKAALLYGEGVKLCSMGAFTILSLGRIGNVNREEQLQLLEAMLPAVQRAGTQETAGFASLINDYRAIIARPQAFHTVKDQLIVRTLEPLLDKTFADMGRAMQKQARHAQADDLIAALNTGLVEVHTFQSADGDTMVKEYLDLLGRAVSDHATLPLFDEQSSSLIRSAIEEEVMSVSGAGIARGKHSALAANLLERLPLFDDAPIDEIMDIRRELEKPLIRFRSAMLQYSENLQSAAWDKDFASDADVVFNRDVAPAILNIEEAVASNNLLAKMVRLGDKSLEIASKSAIGILIAHADFMPDVVAKSVGYGLAGAGIAYDAVNAWRKEQKATENANLFFYYRAGKRLQKTTGPRIKKAARQQNKSRPS